MRFFACLRLRGITSYGELVAGPGMYVTEHQLKRFASGCCRKWWDLPLDVHSSELIYTYERFLDGQASWEEYYSVVLRVFEENKENGQIMISGIHAFSWLPTPYGVSSLTQQIAWVTSSYIHRERIAQLDQTASEDDRFGWSFFGYEFPEFNTTAKTIFAPLPALLREIVGNPFRPTIINPSWLTSTVLALARQMHDSRDFTATPMLADALQDAGCDNEEVLNHCRGPGPHVRGCWVVDRLLL